MGVVKRKLQHETAVRLIRERCLTAPEIGRRTGYCRQHIYCLMRAMGFDTQRKRVSLVCRRCGNEGQYTEHRIGSRRFLRLGYCSNKCYTLSEVFETLVCACGNRFQYRRSLRAYVIKHRNYKNFYCSRKCFTTYSKHYRRPLRKQGPKR